MPGDKLKFNKWLIIQMDDRISMINHFVKLLNVKTFTFYFLQFKYGNNNPL